MHIRATIRFMMTLEGTLLLGINSFEITKIPLSIFYATGRDLKTFYSMSMITECASEYTAYLLVKLGG